MSGCRPSTVAKPLVDPRRPRMRGRSDDAAWERAMRTSRDWHSSAEAIRYAVDTGSLPPTRRTFSLRFAKPLLLGVGAAGLGALAFFAVPAARSSATLASAAADCTTARSAWRPEWREAGTARATAHAPRQDLATGAAPATARQTSAQK